jgi:membrane-associated phospholipid phosphatase
MAVTVLYFAYLAVIGILRRKVLPVVVALLTLASLRFVGMVHVMPLIYLLTGYWLPAALVRTSNASFERRLLKFDEVLFGAHGLDSFVNSAPKWLLEYLELSYLLCYAVVPAGVLWLVAMGFERETDRFWSTVLLASFACYGVLPWLPTRAPRAVERPSLRRSRIRTWNLRVLDRASVQWNTFPSGHTAASLATALAVAEYSPMAGFVLGLIAVSIAIGSVVGRYHYAADAIAGALVAVASVLTATAATAP